MTEAPQILHDSSEYLVISKPAFWVVNEAATAHGNQTVQMWINSNFDFPLAHDSTHRNGIVHRLDKETSGVLLVAKTLKSFENLQRQFLERTTSKTYKALVHGRLTGGGTVTMPIARNTKNRTKFGVSLIGREAETKFELVKVYTRQKGEDYSELLLYPKTGRTHQIRVHMNYIHHPIVSDPLYLGKGLLTNDKKWCSRMFLHAFKLSFNDPQTSESVTVEAPLPHDLAEALSSMK